MPRSRGLAVQFSLRVLLGAGFFFLLLFGYSYRLASDIVTENVRKSAQFEADRAIQRIELLLSPIDATPRALARTLARYPLEEDAFFDLLAGAVQADPNIYGSTAAFEPGAFSPDRRWFSPYAWRGTSGAPLDRRVLGGPEYDYFAMDWYRIPFELNEPVWTEPFFDEGGGDVVMTTCAVPFRRDAETTRTLTGIVTVDVDVASIRDVADSIRVPGGGFVFLLSRNGYFIAHPRADWILNETIFTVAEERGDAMLRRNARAMLEGRPGFFSTDSLLEDDRAWVYHAHLPTFGWTLGIAYPERELFAPVNQLRLTGGLIAGGGLLILLLVTWSIAGSITRPLEELARAAESIGMGRIDGSATARVSAVLDEEALRGGSVAIESVRGYVRRNDEVGRLAEAFLVMRNSITHYIDHLRRTTAAKERIESELSIAREIQMSILPKIFPPFPHRDEFDLHAVIEPAKEVGGDFYDFMLLDERRVLFAIGDVSGKGVPAALFMAITRTLLKVVASHERSPHEMVAEMNGKLCDDNDSGMFVTFFLGVLDFTTGRVEYCNGGHNPPLVRRADGTLEYLKGAHGRALGAMDDSVYRSADTTLAPGDSILLYTDGVTEAMNFAHEQYTPERMEELLRGSGGLAPRAVLENLLADVRLHVGRAPQSDDITAMVVLHRGPKAA